MQNNPQDNYTPEHSQETRPAERYRTAQEYRGAPPRAYRPRGGAFRGGGCVMRVLAFLLGTMFVCGIVYAIFPPAPLDLLVMGLDSRGNEGAVTRTDTIMLVGFNAPARRLSVMSIPRDLFIDVPNYGMQRINTINVLAEMEEAGTGPDLLMQSIARNFDVQPDRYIRMDFEGFKALIDAVGGVDVYIEKRVVDYAYPTDDFNTISVTFEEGWEHMNGERALIYARTRHQDDDYNRASRQQAVLSALAKKLLIPLYWPSAVATLAQYTETNLNPFDMAFMAPTVILNLGNIDQLVVGPEYISPGPGYAVPNYEKLRPLLDERFD